MPGVRGEVPWPSWYLLCPKHGAFAHHDVRGLADRRHQARGAAFHLAGGGIRLAARPGGVAGEHTAAGHLAALASAASAIRRSSAAVIAPATPIAPATWPSASTGRPPAIRARPGRFANDATAAGSGSIAAKNSSGGMPMAAAAYALLIAVCRLTSGAPSIRSTSVSTPDSSTVTTVTRSPPLVAAATAASTNRRDNSEESVGRIVHIPVVTELTSASCSPETSSRATAPQGQHPLRIGLQPTAVTALAVCKFPRHRIRGRAATR